MRNAFRNGIRTGAVCLILALIIGLTLAMLVANTAVNKKISSIRSNIGNNITISAAGMRGMGGIMGGQISGGPMGAHSDGEPSTDSSEGNTLTNDDLDAVKDIDHITSTAALLTKQIDSDDTSLKGVSFGNRPSRPDESSDEDDEDDDSSERTIPVSISGASSLAALGDEVGDLELSDGDEIDLSSTDKVAIIGDQLAENNDLSVGDTFTLYDTEITVKGIISSGEESSDDDQPMGRNLSTGSMVLMPLATLQELADSDDITTIVATVDSVDNADSVTATITKELGTNDDGNNIAEVTSDKESAETTIDSLENIATMSLVSVVACVVVAAVIILLAMLMVVRDRRGEIGIMKAIGAKSKTIIGQFVAESLVITVIATVSGLGIGVAAATPLTNALTNNNQAEQTEQRGPTMSKPDDDSSNTANNNQAGQDFGGDMSQGGPGQFVKDGIAGAGEIVATIDWTLVAYVIAGCLVIASCGAAVASIMAMRINPAEAVRAE
ncbi:MAG: FtsX-like permease family protein [Candidatus Saccharibacteria bacterium]|nr:FtsX-like permease family protein [Candidatus Saccharibacteria bacterium]